MAVWKNTKDVATLKRYESVLAELARDFPQVVVVTGESEFLRAHAVARYRAEWDGAHPDGDLVVIRGAGEARPVTLPDITRELSGGSLFAKEKMVVLRGAERILFPAAGAAAEAAAAAGTGADFSEAAASAKPRDREAGFIACLEKPGAKMWLVVEASQLPQNRTLGKKLSQCGVVVHCDVPNQRELSPWLIDRARSGGKRLHDAAVDLLFRAHGSDPGLLTAEVDKLVLYADERPDIDAEMVGKFLTGTIEFDLWGFTGAIEKRNLKDAVFYARRIALQGSRDKKGKRENAADTAHKILSLVADTVKNLLRARLARERGVNAADFARAEKLQPFRAEILMNASRNYRPRELRLMLTLVADQVRRTHDTGGDVLLSLETLAVRLAGGLLEGTS